MSTSTSRLTLPLIIASAALASAHAHAADRVVLAENFTATWCGYCPSVSSGLLQVINENPESIIGFQVHGSDSYTCPWGNGRLAFYNVSGFPTIYFDGWWSQVGSYGSVNANANNMTNGLNACLSRETDVTVASSGEEISNTQYEVTWEVGVEAGGTEKTVEFYSVQALDSWPSGGNHYFNCVIQHQPEQILTLIPGETQQIVHTYTLSGTSLQTKEDVRYISWVQDVANNGPAQVHNAELHEHNQQPASTVTVGASGADYTTITEAINDVGEFSTITVDPGTYVENIDLQGKNLTLVSAAGPEQTILDAAGNGTVLLMMNEENATTVIDGFTITGGDNSLAGGIKCDSTPQIKNCIIRDNNATYIVAGLMASDSTGPTVTNTYFCNNTINGDPGANIWGNYIDGGGNTFEDGCDTETPCDGDFNEDTTVNVEDLLAVIAAWGTPYDVDDLLMVIANWGSDC